MNIKYKVLNELAKEPTRGSEYAAGYDLYAATDGEISLFPHTTQLIGTGLAFELPDGYFGAVYARSGLASKKGLRPANCVGVVDSDYRGEVMVALHNDSDHIMTIDAGERIAQLVLMPYVNMTFEQVEELNTTNRGEGGFGSTGNK
jgi:dUTP pyrophosphatase